MYFERKGELKLNDILVTNYSTGGRLCLTTQLKIRTHYAADSLNGPENAKNVFPLELSNVGVIEKKTALQAAEEHLVSHRIASVPYRASVKE